MPVIGQTSRAYAIDLLGYGYSDKPDPRCGSVRFRKKLTKDSGKSMLSEHIACLVWAEHPKLAYCSRKQ